MAGTTTLKLRRAWFQVHKWIGLLLFVILIPLSVSGSALVWHDWLDARLNPQRYAVSATQATLAPGRYAELAAGALAPGERIAQLRMPEDEGSPVIVSAAVAAKPGAAPRPGPPQRTSLYLDPADGHLLDRASSSAGLVRWLHVFHGSLQVPGTGRMIVGWLGVLMLVSCLTGIWLWWPTTGSIRRGFRWKRQGKFDGDLHHLVGFWVALPLAILSLTGAWISFPQFFGKLTGEQARPAAGPEAGARRDGGQRAQAGGLNRSPPLAATRLTPDAAVAAANASGKLVSISWPTESAPQWKLSFAGEGRPREIAVDDASGAAQPSADQGRNQGGISRWMRLLHDGNGLGAVWQTIIFVAGLIPAALGITGVTMWLRTRRWRGDIARRKAAKLAPAE